MPPRLLPGLRLPWIRVQHQRPARLLHRHLSPSWERVPGALCGAGPLHRDRQGIRGEDGCHHFAMWCGAVLLRGGLRQGEWAMVWLLASGSSVAQTVACIANITKSHPWVSSCDVSVTRLHVLLQVPCSLWAVYQVGAVVTPPPVLSIPQEFVSNTAGANTTNPTTALLPLGYGVPVAKALLACLPVEDQSIQGCFDATSLVEVRAWRVQYLLKHPYTQQ
jgi:hypothetical protein